MRIVHFSQDFRRGKPQLGGFARLRNTTADGNEHIVFTVHFGDPRLEEFALDHLRVVSIGVPTRRLRWFNRWRVARVLGSRAARWLRAREVAPDVLFGHSQLMNFAVLRTLRAAGGFDCPLLWEANGIGGSQLFDGSRHPAHLWQAAYQAYVFRRASHVIAQTARSKETIVRHYHVPGHRVTVVTNGFDAASNDVVKRYGRLHQPLLAGFIGLHDELNGAPFLLGIADSLTHVAKFRFIGDGPYAPRARELSEAGVVEFLGPLPHRAMAEQLLAIDTLVIPRVRSFGSDHFIPTKLLEAMGLGLVVLAANVGGLSEVIEDGSNGFLFDPESRQHFEEKLTEIAALSPGDVARISSAARETARYGYDWRDRHAILNDVYERSILRG